MRQRYAIPRKPVRGAQPKSPMDMASLRQGIEMAQPFAADDSLSRYADLLARLQPPKAKPEVSIMPVPKRPTMGMPEAPMGRSWIEMVSELMKGSK